MTCVIAAALPLFGNLRGLTRAGLGGTDPGAPNQFRKILKSAWFWLRRAHIQLVEHHAGAGRSARKNQKEKAYGSEHGNF